jgi:hypothetical protein
MACRLIAGAALVLSLSGRPVLAAQSSAPPAAATTDPPQAIDMPIDLARIKRGLTRDRVFELKDTVPTFRVEIVGKFPTFEERFGKVDLQYGAVPGTPMTHADFVEMVTPRIMNSSGGITASETLQFALVGFLAKAAVKKALNAYTTRQAQEELRAIRLQIDRELAALRGGGR